MTIIYSIMRFITFFKESKANIKQKYFRTKTQTYIKVLVLFSVLFVSIIGQAILSRPANAYSETAVDESISFDAGEITILKKEYSPISRSYRMDIYIDTEIDIVTDGAPITKAKVVTQEDIETPMDVTVIPVSEKYFVLVAPKINEDFGAVRFDLTYKRSKEAEETTVSLYGSQDKSSVVESDFSEINEAELKISSLENDIRLQQSERKTIEEKNKTIVDNIKNTKEQIESFTEEKEYQVGEQLTKTEDTITTLENAIQSYKGEISDNQAKIGEIETTIILINEKINELSKGRD
ncbi:hypothetical protein ABE902_15905 [Enterococcus casseliflavus]|uniref:hypothetical protein n=1 Tax=Enterococcus casseliflavus TaxID=37734 RepID=UPI00115D7E00